MSISKKIQNFLVSCFKITIIFKLSLGHLLIYLLNILEVQTEIPTESIDYWIGNVSPRCAINIIYYNFTNDFSFESTHEIPVMFVPLEYHHDWEPRLKYLKHNNFFNSSLRFLKAECYFSIIYYKVLDSFTNRSEEDPIILDDLMGYIAYGFPSSYESNTTHCLILYHTNVSNNGGLQSSEESTDDISVALVYVSNSSVCEYTVYCRTPSTVFEAAAVNLVNRDASIVNQKFISACTASYKFVILEEYSRGVTDYAGLDYEHEIIKHILLKVNASIKSPSAKMNRHPWTLPRIRVNDFEQAMLFSPTFESSIRIFSCFFTPVLSFHFYISAFEKSVWISIALSGTLLAVFLNYQIYHNISQSINFSSVLFYFSIFMEETFSIPSKIGNNRVHRISTILWLLTAIVLTNTYVSHVISGLNAPLRGEKLRTTVDLYGNSTNATEKTILHFFNADPLLRDWKNNFNFLFKEEVKYYTKRLHLKQRLADGYTILSEPMRLPYPEDVWLNLGNPYVYSVAYNMILLLRHCFWYLKSFRYPICRQLINMMNPSNKYYPSAHTYKRQWNSSDYPRGAVEEELIKCQKSVYLEQSNQLEFKYMSESYKKKRFYYLQDQFTSKKSVWGFYNLQKSRIPFYFSMFLQSGIYHELHKLKLLKDHQKRRYVTEEIINRTQKPQVLDMTSSIQTIFILFAAMSLLAKLAFAAELGYPVMCKLPSKVKHFMLNEAKIQKRFFQLSKHFYPRSKPSGKQKCDKF